ncbi:MAG: Slp family lipoprotein [Gammaproteobacteria bacterium]
MKQILAGLFLFSLLYGCASDVPLVIREPLADNPWLAEVQSNPKAFLNRRVRWGGTIVSTKSVGNKAEVEILAKAIDTDGRPEPGDVSLGRFLVSSDGFLDPATYSEGREVTVHGVLDDVLMGKIGEHPYAYPFVRAIQLYLWPEQRDYGDGTWYPQFHFGVGVGVGL